MALIADGLMIAASLVAAIYCMVLSSRVRRLKDLDRGLGAAIAGLSHQVDGMQGALEQAKRISGSSVRELRDMTARAEVAAGRLELLLASIHDRDGTRPVTRPKREAGAASPPRDALRRETDGRDALRRDTDPRDETRRETGLRETGLREGLRAAAPVAQRRSMAQPVTLARFETDEDEAEAEDRLLDRDGRDEAAALPEDVFRLADTPAPAPRGPAPAHPGLSHPGLSHPGLAQPGLARPAPVAAGADQPARVPLALRPRPPAPAPVPAAAAAAPAPLPSPAAEVADLRRSLRAILGKADA